MSKYRQTSNIRCTLVVGAAPTTYFILNLTPGFNGLAKGNCKTRRQSFKFCNLVRLIASYIRDFTVHYKNPQKHINITTVKQCTLLLCAYFLGCNLQVQTSWCLTTCWEWQKFTHLELKIWYVKLTQYEYQYYYTNHNICIKSENSTVKIGLRRTKSSKSLIRSLCT